MLLNPAAGAQMLSYSMPAALLAQANSAAAMNANKVPPQLAPLISFQNAAAFN